MKNLIVILSLITLCSCFTDRFKLTEKEKEFNPYEVGDILIMESSKNKIDTLFISEIDLVFNDGIGITEYKQALRVYEGETPKKGDIMDRPTFLFEIRSGGSKEPTYVEFRNFQGKKQYLTELLNNSNNTLRTRFGNYDDIIDIKGNLEKKYEELIYNIKWSLRNGIVQYETGDSTTWTLKEVIKK